MVELIEVVTEILAKMTIVGDGAIILGLVAVVFLKGNKLVKRAQKYVEEKGLWLAWVVALVAMMGSLFFSEVALYTPCKLCWYQRIFMYPLVVLLLMAAVRKEKRMAVYGLALSLIGGVIASYHYFVQVSQTEILPCSIVGYAASCTEQFFLRYGYITIVTMSWTAFMLISVILGVVMAGGGKTRK